MATESSRSSADSYIGSLISLTSKSEIRYEGVLYSINTEESSIGLRDVRSFGTEGRKNGSQIPASDKIYEFILFRGSDIKDLQVKSSPPPQPASVHNDPAIIQSQYSRLAPASSSLPSVSSGNIADSSHTAQLGLPKSTFQGGLPPDQPGQSLGSWGTVPPPTADGSGLAMPAMYWQGYYPPSGGFPHLQTSSMLQSPGELFHPSMQQSIQYPAINTTVTSRSPNLTAYPPFLQPISSTPSLTSTTLPSALVPSQESVLTSETSSNMIPNKAPATSLPATSLGPDLPFFTPLTSTIETISTVGQTTTIVGSQPRPVVLGRSIPYQTTSQSIPLTVSSSLSSQMETPMLLVTPGQLLQPGPPTLPSSQSSQLINREVEIKPPEPKARPSIPETLVPAHPANEPILPLPTHADRKTNGTGTYTFHSNRGRGRGTRNECQRPVTKFTKEFDFIAMNEKFKKDEVWGHLGKSQAESRDRDGNFGDEGADDEEDGGALKREIKPVYVKDDFFDSLSCNALDHGSRNGRMKFSEQLKIDTETFGNFPRHRPIRGGGRGMRGGGHARGSYYGRGYGYVGRGRGY